MRTFYLVALLCCAASAQIVVEDALYVEGKTATLTCGTGATCRYSEDGSPVSDSVGTIYEDGKVVYLWQAKTYLIQTIAYGDGVSPVFESVTVTISAVDSPTITVSDKAGGADVLFSCPAGATCTGSCSIDSSIYAFEHPEYQDGWVFFAASPGPYYCKSRAKMIGYADTDFEVIALAPICVKPCSNGGTCSFKEEGGDAFAVQYCFCSGAFAGDSCDIPCDSFDQMSVLAPLYLSFYECYRAAILSNNAQEFCNCISAAQTEIDRPENVCLDSSSLDGALSAFSSYLPCPNPDDASGCKLFGLADSMIMDGYHECFREVSTFAEECPCFDAVRDKARLFPDCPNAQLLEKKAIGRKVNGGICPKPDMSSDLNWCGKYITPCHGESGMFVQDEILVDQEGFGLHKSLIMKSCEPGAMELGVREMERIQVDNFGASKQDPEFTRYAIRLVDGIKEEVGGKEYSVVGDLMFMMCKPGAVDGDLECNEGGRWRKRGWSELGHVYTMKRVEACTASFPDWRAGFVEDIRETAAAAHEVYNLNHAPRRWRLQMERKREELTWTSERHSLFINPFME